MDTLRVPTVCRPVERRPAKNTCCQFTAQVSNIPPPPKEQHLACLHLPPPNAKPVKPSLDMINLVSKQHLVLMDVAILATSGRALRRQPAQGRADARRAHADCGSLLRASAFKMDTSESSWAVSSSSAASSGARRPAVFFSNKSRLRSANCADGLKITMAAGEGPLARNSITSRPAPAVAAHMPRRPRSKMETSCPARSAAVLPRIRVGRE